MQIFTIVDASNESTFVYSDMGWLQTDHIPRKSGSANTLEAIQRKLVQFENKLKERKNKLCKLKKLKIVKLVMHPVKV